VAVYLLTAAYLLFGAGLGAYSLWKVREPTRSDALATLAVLTLFWPVVVLSEWLLWVDRNRTDDPDGALGKWEAVEDSDFQVWYVRWSIKQHGRWFYAKTYHSGTLDARWLAERDAQTMNREGVLPAEIRSVR
jgi:hypothetical protein